MKTIHLAAEDGKNARVPLLRGRSLAPKTLQVSVRGQEIVTRTVHRGNATVGSETLTATALIEGDPDIDLQNIGKILPESTRAFRRRGATTLEGNFGVMVTTFATDGTMKDRSPLVPKRANINDVAPVKMGKRMPVEEMFRRFAFNNQYFLGHEDGIQHGFLLALARDLESKGEAAMLGAGPKGNQPLIFRDGGTPTRAFLMGDTDGDRYRLRVLLTRQELKIPEARTARADAPAAAS